MHLKHCKTRHSSICGTFKLLFLGPSCQCVGGHFDAVMWAGTISSVLVFYQQIQQRHQGYDLSDTSNCWIPWRVFPGLPRWVPKYLVHHFFFLNAILDSLKDVITLSKLFLSVVSWTLKSLFPNVLMRIIQLRATITFSPLEPGSPFRPGSPGGPWAKVEMKMKNLLVPNKS